MPKTKLVRDGASLLKEDLFAHFTSMMSDLDVRLRESCVI